MKTGGIVLVPLAVFFALGIYACNSSGNRYAANEEEVVVEVPIENKAGLRSVNFYLENSGSMNPYTAGNTNFNKAMANLLRNIELLPLDTVQVYAVNTQIHPLEQDISFFLNSLNKSGIPKIGDTNDSDLHLIFENILQNHQPETISILVTDGIYSVKGTQQQLIQDLEQKVFNTRNAFISTLREKNFATLCLKMISNYDGMYYPAAGGQIRINQDRPYYIWVFGDSNLLKSFAENAELFKLAGFSNYFYNLKQDSAAPAYSIVEHSMGDLGSFKSQSRQYPIHTIVDSKRSSRPDTKGQFGFAVAVDFSDVPLPEEQMLNPANYQVTGEDYSLYDIVKIDSQLDQKIVGYLNGIQANMTGVQFTHILLLKTSGRFLQSFSVDLYNPTPDWIVNTGIDDDSAIQGNTSQTFGFDKLTAGILNAYDQVNKTDKVLSLHLNVK